jgi:hypothetical protein
MKFLTHVEINLAIILRTQLRQIKIDNTNRPQNQGRESVRHMKSQNAIVSGFHFIQILIFFQDNC